MPLESLSSPPQPSPSAFRPTTAVGAALWIATTGCSTEKSACDPARDDCSGETEGASDDTTDIDEDRPSGSGEGTGTGETQDPEDTGPAEEDSGEPPDDPPVNLLSDPGFEDDNGS